MISFFILASTFDFFFFFFFLVLICFENGQINFFVEREKKESEWKISFPQISKEDF